MYRSPNYKENNKKYYSKINSSKEAHEKRKKYYKDFRERHKERLSKNRKEKYEKNREEFLKKAKEYRDRNGGKLKVRGDGLTIQEDRTRRNYINKIRALQLVGKKDIPECVICKEMDIKVLTINHINGEGNKEKKEKKHAKVSVEILKGRDVSDLDVRCFNCNIRYEYERGQRFTPIDEEALYKALTTEPIMNSLN